MYLTYLVELLGTMFFIYVMLVTHNALASGAALAIAIIIGRQASVTYFNPILTIIMTLSGHKPMNTLLPNLVAQFSGGLLALHLSKHIK